LHNFLEMFIAFLYTFRATMCRLSSANTVPMRHLVFVTLYGWLLCRAEVSFRPAYRTVIHIEWQTLGVA